MRDPDLVYRAERAAIALERAWSDWRVMHGAGTGPLPQITSYVGYSLAEPWGEPRVVLGVPADEAERLAALLEGHDCFGPVHAEVASRPDWRRGAAGGPADNGDVADAGGRSYDGSIDVPAQARGPEAAQISASWQDLPHDSGSAAWDNAARVRAARDSVTQERVARDSVARDRAARERADESYGGNGLPRNRPTLPDDGASLPDVEPPGASRPEVPWDYPAVPLLPVPDNGQPESAQQQPPAPGAVPVQGGPGYRGPRYLGSPPRYQHELDGDRTDADRAAAGTPADADGDDRAWVDLGPAVSAVGSDVEAGLLLEAGLSLEADRVSGADSAPEAGFAADADVAAHADVAGQTGPGAAGDLVADAANADVGLPDGGADRPVGKGAAKPARATTKKTVRRTRSTAGKAAEPARASAVMAEPPLTDAEPAPAEPAPAEPERTEPPAVIEADQDAPGSDGDISEAPMPDSADDDRPGAPEPDKTGRTRSRSVARRARSRRSAPGAHEGSGWPATGRTAKNSKV